jgi:hypothetical protein
MQLRKDDAKAFAKELHQLVVAWRERHGQPRPRLSREELACRELAKRYHECEDEQEKETIRHELALAVDKAFETRMKAMEARVQRMEKELDAFQKRLDLLKENREAVCGERLDELLRPPELDWDGDW